MNLKNSSATIYFMGNNGCIKPIANSVSTRLEAVHGEESGSSDRKWPSPSWSLSCEVETTPAINELFESLDNICQWTYRQRYLIFFGYRYR